MIIRKKMVTWLFGLPLVSILVLLLVSSVGSGPHDVSTNWYTQIGSWHLVPKESPPSRFFLFHDANKDGARSGEATAQVRLNTKLRLIRYCELELLLGPAQSTAGLLLQDTLVTLLFLAKKNTIYDSLVIYRLSNHRVEILGSVATSIVDTTRLTLYGNADSLWFSSKKTIISIAKPKDFSRLSTVGFECLSGSVKIFSVYVEAANTVVTDSFDHATLFNLHLEKMLSAKSVVP